MLILTVTLVVPIAKITLYICFCTLSILLSNKLTVLTSLQLPSSETLGIVSVSVISGVMDWILTLHTAGVCKNKC